MRDEKSDKRLHPRHSLHKNVRVEVDGVVYEGETSDISLGGVSVVADTNLSNDAFVHMHIETIGEMTGHVVRSTEGGFAVKFDPIKEEKDRLEQHLKSMFGNDETDSAPSTPEKNKDQLEADLKSMFEKD